MQTRRQLLGSTAAASLLARPTLASALMRRAPLREPKRILILGGTGFLGPALIDAVLERGHHLTLFNSGLTEERRTDAGRPSIVPEGVETRIGNRDPELTADDRRYPDDPERRDPASPRGLAQLEDGRWDAVIDTSGYFPRLVRASAELLAERVHQYVFISTISVYARNDREGQDESAELAQLEDPTVETFGASFENYGGAKALCEAAAEAAMPGRVTNVRPGFIVGRRDTTRRFLWWPWRTAQGGAMAVPGSPTDPVQVIDVRDLAEWIVRCTEERVVGVFNATGPAEELTMEAMLRGCAQGLNAANSAAGADATAPAEPVWVAPEFLAEHELSYPIWVPPSGETAGFHRVDVGRAVAQGLTFRSIADTAADALAWHSSLTPELQAGVLPPIDLEREREVLALWSEREQ